MHLQFTKIKKNIDNILLNIKDKTAILEEQLVKQKEILTQSNYNTSISELSEIVSKLSEKVDQKRAQLLDCQSDLENLVVKYSDFDDRQDNLDKRVINLEQIIEVQNPLLEALKKDLENFHEQRKLLDIQLQVCREQSRKLLDDGRKEQSVKEIYTDDMAKMALFIQKGKESQDEHIYRVNEYSFFQENAEINLQKVGYRGSGAFLIRWFISVLKCNYVPLLCGYGSQSLAIAMLASIYAEIPEVISVPGGFMDVHLLNSEISAAPTKSVIIADAFGKMNESILLPILRSYRKKKIVLIAESTEDLRYVPRYMFNYIQLLTFDVQNLRPGADINIKRFADATHVLEKLECEERTYELFELLLQDNTIVSKPYVNSRRTVFQLCRELLGTACFYEFLTIELKWLLTDTEKKKILDDLEKYSAKYDDEIDKIRERLEQR